MEANWRWVLLTAVAPITWGSVYVVTRQLLPDDIPLWGAALRALPAGVLLLLIVRRLPRGRWWWRSAVLGVLNVAVFFVLVYLAAVLLPSSVAASVMALSPLALMAFALPLAGERPAGRTVVAAVSGIVGVLLIVTTATGRIEPWGVAASASALVLWSLGSVLSKRWADGTPVLHVTAWQLVFGGIVLTVVAIAVEGAPPALDGPAIAGQAFITLIATGIAYLCWFAGLARLAAGTVGIVGLLNPVTGVVLSMLVGGEALSTMQAVGIALVLGAVALGRQRAARSASSAPRGAGHPQRQDHPRRFGA